MNLVGSILKHAITSPDAPAIIENERALNYRELGELVVRTSAHLVALGIGRGDRVGLCLRETADNIVAFLAVARAGAVTVPLDWRAREREHARLLGALSIKLLLAESDVRLPPNCPGVVLDAAWHRAVAACEPSTSRATDWRDGFLIAATSGSVGLPKLTLLTHLQFFFRIAASLEVMGLAGRHRYLSTLPMYYSGGRTRCLAHLIRGDCVILYPSLFSPSEYLEEVRGRGATVGYVVPSMLRQLLAAARDQVLLPKMALLFSSGAPLYAEEKLDAVRRLTPHFHEEYGAAEIGVITVLRPADLHERAGSVGQPHSLVDIEIVDDDNHVLPIGSIGHVRFRGPALGSPIVGTTAEGAGDPPGDPWHLPGEVGHVDERGFLFIQGRTSDVIIRGGAKIYPSEVESVIQEHPDVIEAAVVGHRASSNEEEVVAFVVIRTPLQVGQLIAHCRSRLTPHKVPSSIHFLPHLPKNTSGKIDRVALSKSVAG